MINGRGEEPIKQFNFDNNLKCSQNVQDLVKVFERGKTNQEKAKSNLSKAENEKEKQQQQGVFVQVEESFQFDLQDCHQENRSANSIKGKESSLIEKAGAENGPIRDRVSRAQKLSETRSGRLLMIRTWVPCFHGKCFNL